MKVTHHAYGTGEIVSQDDTNVTVNFSGDIKTLVIKFAKLMNEDGSPFGQHAGLIPVVKKSRTAKKHERDAREIAAFNAQTNLDKIKQSILWINGKVQGDRNSTGYQLISERLAGIWLVAKEQGNTFIVDVINSVEKSMRASEKQAYVIAKFADDNGIKYE